MSFNTAGNWNQSPDNLVVNVSTAYLDADQEKDFSAGVNAVWQRIGLGYIFAANDIKQYKPTISTDNLDSADSLGKDKYKYKYKYKIHTVNASYLIPNVMDMDNFNVYLGSYQSHLSRDENQGGGSDNRYGARVRFKYFF